MIALIIMVNLDSIQTARFISLLFGAGMGSVLVLSWFWERINLFSEITAIVASLVVTEVEWVRLGSMALISTTAAVTIPLFTS